MKKGNSGKSFGKPGKFPKGKGGAGKAFGEKKSYGDKPRRSYGDDKPSSDRPKRAYGEGKSYGDKPRRSYGDEKPSFDRPKKTYGEKKSYGDKPSYDRPRKMYGEKKEFGDKPRRSYGDEKPAFDRPKKTYGEKKSFGDKPSYDRPKRSYGEKKEYGDKPRRSYGDEKPAFDRPRKTYGEKKSFGDKPRRSFGDEKPQFDRPKRSYGENKSFGDKPRRSSGDEKPAYDRPRKTYGEKKSYGDKKPFGDKPRRSFGDEKPAFDGPKKTYGSKKTYGDKPQRSTYAGKPRKRYESEEEQGSEWQVFNNDKEASAFRKESGTIKATSDILTGEIRLNKYIANAGVCSRREADELIKVGAVEVNGKVVTEMGYKVKPGDIIHYGGELLRREVMSYVLLNKPKDYITTTDDPRERKTVMELVQDAGNERIVPVGRLDRNTTGLLLLTNDGELAAHLTHPRYEIKKIYQVSLDKNLRPEDMEAIANGLELEDGIINVDEITYVGDGKDRKEIGIEIHSGRNRIVRRIFEHLGYDVLHLDRVYFGGLTKKNLPRGRWRFLTENEVSMLKMVAGGFASTKKRMYKRKD